MSATVLDRYIYAIGGYDGRLRMRSTERYDSRANQWNQVASMLDRRSDAGASAMRGMRHYCTALMHQDNACLTHNFFFEKHQEICLCALAFEQQKQVFHCLSNGMR